MKNSLEFFLRKLRICEMYSNTRIISLFFFLRLIVNPVCVFYIHVHDAM